MSGGARCQALRVQGPHLRQKASFSFVSWGAWFAAHLTLLLALALPLPCSLRVGSCAQCWEQGKGHKDDQATAPPGGAPSQSLWGMCAFAALHS